MTLTELTSNLSKVEDKIRNSDRHNCTFISMIHLVLFADGSGEVLGTRERNLEKSSREQYLPANILIDDSEVFKFEKIAEFELWITQKLKETS